MHLKSKDQQLKTILYMYSLLYQNLMIGTSLVVQWLGLRAFTAVGLGSILVRKLRSHKPQGEAKKKKKKKKITRCAKAVDYF